LKLKEKSLGSDNRERGNGLLLATSEEKYPTSAERGKAREAKVKWKLKNNCNGS